MATPNHMMATSEMMSCMTSQSQLSHLQTQVNLHPILHQGLLLMQEKLAKPVTSSIDGAKKALLGINSSCSRTETLRETSGPLLTTLMSKIANTTSNYAEQDSTTKSLRGNLEGASMPSSVTQT